jgi:hypothetical protein
MPEHYLEFLQRAMAQKYETSRGVSTSKESGWLARIKMRGLNGRIDESGGRTFVLPPAE